MLACRASPPARRSYPAAEYRRGCHAALNRSRVRAARNHGVADFPPLKPTCRRSSPFERHAGDLVVSTYVNSFIIGIVAALSLAGPGFVYGGYACKPEQRYSAWLLYCYGGGCFCAAIVLTALVASGWIVKESDSPQHISNSSSAAPSDESGFDDGSKEVAGVPPSVAVSVPSPSVGVTVPSPNAPRVFVTVRHRVSGIFATNTRQLKLNVW